MKKTKAKKPAPVDTRPFAETAEPMSAEQFRKALEKLDISQSAFARLMGLGDRSVRNWLADIYPLPMSIGYLLTLMLKTGTKPQDLKL